MSLLRRIEQGAATANEPAYPFADRTTAMGGSVIREILKLTQNPDIISFAGGLPSDNGMQTSEQREQLRHSASVFGSRFGQYGATEGFPEFLEAGIPYLRSLGVRTDAAVSIRVATGSQQTLFLAAEVFINPGDIIVTDEPTYLGALQAFSPFGPKYAPVPADAEGMMPDALRAVLSKGGVKLIYLNDTFKNPDSVTMSEKRRHEIAEVVRRHNREHSTVVVLEDDPYSRLRYEGRPVVPIQSIIPEFTIFTASLSKLLEPGYRLAYFVAPHPIADMMVKAKQGIDLFTPTGNQAEATIYLRDGLIEPHISHVLIPMYRKQRDVMLELLEKHFPPEWTFTHPEGGMFIWAVGPEGADTESLLIESIKRKVAFVPGYPFYSNPDLGRNTMRLNFSHSTLQELSIGIPRLGQVIREFTSPAH